VTKPSTESAHQTWERAAHEVQPGWKVTQFDASTGESFGSVEAPPQLDAGVFRVPVCWSVGALHYRGVVEAPLSQRTARYFDSSLLISGVGGMWWFTPKG
jgi:hypothetical protein